MPRLPLPKLNPLPPPYNRDPACPCVTLPPTARLTLGEVDVVVSPLSGRRATSTVMSMLTEPSTSMSRPVLPAGAAAAVAAELHLHRTAQQHSGA
jgi:hypothetical protein